MLRLKPDRTTITTCASRNNISKLAEKKWMVRADW